MVLMSCECGAAGEGLLAVGVGALVWPLARMNPSVAGERTAVTERLGDCQLL
jgi:hypothetical protein